MMGVASSSVDKPLVPLCCSIDGGVGSSANAASGYVCTSIFFGGGFGGGGVPKLQEGFEIQLLLSVVQAQAEEGELPSYRAFADLVSLALLLGSAVVQTQAERTVAELNGR